MATTLSSNLVRLRTAGGWSQGQIAEKAGISRQAYRALETGESEPRGRTLMALAAALGARTEDLLRPARELHAVRFRADKQLRRRAQVLGEVARWLDDYDELEELLGDRLEPSVLLGRRADTNDPVALAERTRKKLKLDSDSHPRHLRPAGGQRRQGVPTSRAVRSLLRPLRRSRVGRARRGREHLAAHHGRALDLQRRPRARPPAHAPRCLQRGRNLGRQATGSRGRSVREPLPDAERRLREGVARGARPATGRPRLQAEADVPRQLQDGALPRTAEHATTTASGGSSSATTSGGTARSLVARRNPARSTRRTSATAYRPPMSRANRRDCPRACSWKIASRGSSGVRSRKSRSA